MRNQITGTLIITISLTLSGCKDYKPEMERAMMERDSVMMMSIAKDSSINAFLETLNQIELNLDSITQKQQAISADTRAEVEFNKDIRERINQNIAFINEVLEKNKNMIASLNAKLKSSNINLASLKNMVEKLNADILKKDEELLALNEDIMLLRDQMSGMSRTIDSLRIENTQKENVISTKTTQLHTAYWTIGTYKQLKSKNILNKKGGFIGLGREQVLKKDFNNDAFNVIDITKVTRFDINSKSVKVVTNHPSGSYRLDKDAKGVVVALEITDPVRFWSASKYLVIVTG
jgi:predicted  nucleic acid-binding Zn-ribbon protein